MCCLLWVIWSYVIHTAWFPHLFFCKSALGWGLRSHGKSFLAGGRGGARLKRIPAVRSLNIYFSAASRASWDSALAPPAFGFCSGRLFHNNSGLFLSPYLLCCTLQSAAMWLFSSSSKSVTDHVLQCLQAQSRIGSVYLHTYPLNYILAWKCRLWSLCSRSVGYGSYKWSDQPHWTSVVHLSICSYFSQT